MIVLAGVPMSRLQGAREWPVRYRFSRWSDVGFGERLVAAGDAFSGAQVQDGGFGDVVSVGEFERGGAVSIGLDEFVDGVAGESASDVPDRPELDSWG